MPDFELTCGTVESGGTPVTPSTRFDLASLTKPLVTAPLCMAAIELGFINLDDPLSRFFPGSVPGDKEGITVKNLLSHSSGLPAYEPFYLQLIELPAEERRNALASMILQTPLEAVPGKTASYSDLGYMLLGLILERQMGERLDRLARDLIFNPLGIDDLHFCPTNGGRRTEDGRQMENGKDFETHFPSVLRPPSSGLSYAATQFCPWRKRLLLGEVDDENAWCLNGVSGHAGLFGTARGVFKLLSFLWNIYEGQGRVQRLTPQSSLLSPDFGGQGGFLGPNSDPVYPHKLPCIRLDLVRLFWTRTRLADGLSDWCLGYDTPSPKGPSSAGRYFSQNSIGHLGFTGVSFWLDLEKRVLVIFLTNRVHPGRQNDEIKKLRPVLHDIIMEAIA
jgi:CubicO group peptidase (beta-lactamase class C family)